MAHGKRSVTSHAAPTVIGTNAEISRGDHDPPDVAENGLEHEIDDEYDENPFHNVGPIITAVQGGLVERIVRVLDYFLERSHADQVRQLPKCSQILLKIYRGQRSKIKA